MSCQWWLCFYQYQAKNNRVVGWHPSPSIKCPAGLGRSGKSPMAGNRIGRASWNWILHYLRHNISANHRRLLLCIDDLHCLSCLFRLPLVSSKCPFVSGPPSLPYLDTAFFWFSSNFAFPITTTNTAQLSITTLSQLFERLIR